MVASSGADEPAHQLGRGALADQEDLGSGQRLERTDADGVKCLYNCGDGKASTAIHIQPPVVHWRGVMESMMHLLPGGVTAAGYDQFGGRACVGDGCAS